MQGTSILFGALAAAFVVLCGAAYALLFALGRLRRSRLATQAAWWAYGALFASALVLARALGLDGFWTLVIVVMLVGYLLAPLAVWHLCVGTHRGDAILVRSVDPEAR